MNRRFFLQTAFATALTGKALASCHTYQLINKKKLDKYGGWMHKKFKATGFFRVEKDKRWWLVTPEGHAFLSFGINHVYPDLWNQAYNQSAWEKRLGLPNLDNPQFEPALRDWFLKTSQEYGFNTVGVHNALTILNHPRPVVPYIQPITFVDIPHWKAEVSDENFLDVFSEAYLAHCDRLARKIALPAKDDPYLLGYSMTDCPLFTEEDCRERTDTIGGARRKARIGWPRRLRNLGENRAGKKAYVLTMQIIYKDKIEGFNTTYATSFDSFDALAKAENWRPNTDLSNANETRDNIQFLKVVVNQYYTVAKAAIRQYDPNHLFIGDKINANTDAMDTILTTTAKYTDVILYQMYGRYEVQESGLDRWAKKVDQPIINGDSAFTMITDTMPRPYGPIANNLRQRAEWTETFFRKAFARPEFVGWHYCGLIDAPNLVPRKQDRQHSGLLDGYGEPHPMLQKVLKACAEEKYAIAIYP